MIKIDSQRSEHMNALHRKHGFRLDDAASGADYVVQVLRESRNDSIVALRRFGAPIRFIAKLYGISHVQVLRVVRERATDVPLETPNLSTAA